MIIQRVLNAFKKRRKRIKLQPPKPTLDGAMVLNALHFDISNNQELANKIIKESCEKCRMVYDEL